MNDELRFPADPPKFEVWNHLESGLDMARNEIAEPHFLDEPPKLREHERQLLDRWAELAFSGLTQLVLDPSAKGQEFEGVRRIYNAPGAEPWLNFAVDLCFAEEGVARAQGALGRYGELRGIRLPPSLSKRTRGYVRVAAQTFLFGFDPACIAFCGAAIEQELKEACLRAGIYTDRAIHRERPTGHTCLFKGQRGGLIKKSFDVAKRTLDQRDRVLHRGVEQQEDLHDEAVQHLIALGEVFWELDASRPR